MSPPPVPLPVLHLSGSPAELGRQHARQARDLIRAAIPVRWQLCREATTAAGIPRPEGEIRSLAQACWDFHQAAVPELMEELSAMAAAAEVDPLGLLIQNGYTDFRDCLHACLGEPEISRLAEGCTAFAIGAPATRNGSAFLGQTWDMHRSALPYVTLLALSPRDKPRALMISLAGCLGMIGLNSAGLAVCTNNLHARTGQIGLFWPFLMRRMLECETLSDARERLLEFPVAGGHNYLIMEASGCWTEIERLPTRTHERSPADGQTWTVHTNHCLSSELVEDERIDSTIGRSSSLERLRQATEFLRQRNGAITQQDLFQLTALESTDSPHMVCMRPLPDFDMQTCAALVMEPAQRKLWAAWGRPAESSFIAYDFPP